MMVKPPSVEINPPTLAEVSVTAVGGWVVTVGTEEAVPLSDFLQQPNRNGSNKILINPGVNLTTPVFIYEGNLSKYGSFCIYL